LLQLSEVFHELCFDRLIRWHFLHLSLIMPELIPFSYLRE